MAVIPTGAIYKSLVFDGEDSRDYGVYITGQAVYNAPERDVEMISIPGRNGSFALDKGRFQNIEVSYPAGIFADNETDFAQGISDFRNFLCSRNGYVRLTDDYNPDEYRMAVYKSGLDVSSAQLKAGEFQIVFDCKPQRYLTSGEEPITIGEWRETETASGSIATFDAVETDAVKSLSCDIEPIQDLHGYDKPWSGGAGKNLLNVANPFRFTFNTEITLDKPIPSGSTIYIYRKSYQYTVEPSTGNKYPVIVFFNGSTAIANIWINPDGTKSKKQVSDQVTSIKIWSNGWDISASQGVEVTITDLMISLTEEDAYEPYSNICPISGHDEVNVYVSPTTSETDATVYTTDLNGTVYGGTVDVVSGVLTVTDGNIASYNGEILPSTWISDRDVYASGTTPTTGAQVVYKLATPQTVQLTAQEVELLVGTNNVWNDCGDTTVEYGTAPNVLINPTPFEASPMLEVTGYGDINIGDDTVTVQYTELGEIKISNPATGATATVDVANLNTGDTIYSNSTTQPNLVLAIKMSGTQNLDVRVRSDVTNGSATIYKGSRYRSLVTVVPSGVSFVKGASQTITTTVPLTVTINSTPTNCTLTVTTSYDGADTITMSATRTDFPSNYLTYTETFAHPSYYGDSTQTALPTPMYIDLDLGEAYGVLADEMISFNNIVQIPAELPKLKVGVNTITTDNTITDLKVIPRWWKI